MDDVKSKSQLKREADLLQKVGVQLIGLSMAKLERLPLTTQLKQAIVEAKSLKSHGAVRRQAQLIGKLMRSADSEAIIAAYKQEQAEDSAQTAKFHELELWRDRLIHDGKEALTAYITCHPLVDVQLLRQLIKKAVDEHLQGLHLGAAKALFRFLRANIQ
ncbi:MAG: ribosome biogenesis factor YjgA [Legionella sp.]